MQTVFWFNYLPIAITFTGAGTLWEVVWETLQSPHCHFRIKHITLGQDRRDSPELLPTLPFTQILPFSIDVKCKIFLVYFSTYVFRSLFLPRHKYSRGAGEIFLTLVGQTKCPHVHLGLSRGCRLSLRASRGEKDLGTSSTSTSSYPLPLQLESGPFSLSQHLPTLIRIDHLGGNSVVIWISFSVISFSLSWWRWVANNMVIQVESCWGCWIFWWLLKDVSSPFKLEECFKAKRSAAC